MSVPVQRSLSSFRSNPEYPLFGKEYNNLNEKFVDIYKLEDSDEDFLSLDEILSQSLQNADESNVNSEDDVYDSIIDFPNFLMHVFKSYDSNCQLNANFLQETYEKLQPLDSMDFVKRLLKYRTLFDRYVVKTTGKEDDEESIRWMMKKPYKDKKGYLKVNRNTFSTANDEPDLCFLSKFETNDVSASMIINFLDKWMLNLYEQLIEKTGNDSSEWAFEALGVDTPHFIFNFIDYLYWVESCNPKPENHISYIEEVKDFDFKYYNSVEHHLPQSYENIDQVNIDSIGNLCLISRSGNSSLNDKAPKEKARIVLGLSPKRRIMYTITQNCDGKWDRKRIEEHCDDIKNLLNKRYSILNIPKT